MDTRDTKEATMATCYWTVYFTIESSAVLCDTVRTAHLKDAVREIESREGCAITVVGCKR